ncbi:MAG: two pore domain potassium channel family protein [Gammaproteobacteria bacterium]|nr:two pore domain potassium channel family protein [Gammaproteobacteria bacterium]
MSICYTGTSIVIFSRAMAKILMRRVIGLAGVPKSESVPVRRLAVFFEWYMLCIAFWLPIQWYLEHKRLLSAHLAQGLNWYVWASFITEAVILGSCVKRQGFYFRTNWLNLVIIGLACPSLYVHFHNLGMLRVIRLLILLRVIVPWIRSARDVLTLNRIGMSLMIFFIVTSLSGVIVSTFDSGIADPLTGIWWAWETVTTVGYGDVVPVSPEGRVIAVLVMLLGIILFSIVTASISAYFVGKDKATVLYNLINRNHQSLTDIERYMSRSSLPFASYSEKDVENFVNQLTTEEKAQLLKILRESIPEEEED